MPSFGAVGEVSNCRLVVGRALSIVGMIEILMSIIIFIVMSGVGFGYLKNDIMRWGPPINMKVMFGCGIGVGLLLIIVIWFFFVYPLLIVHYLLTFPVLISMAALYIVYTQPSEMEKCLDAWNAIWNTSLLVTQLQVESRCCGWWNATDRSIPNCHMEYESGCRHVFERYLEPRLFELNMSGIVILFLVCSGVVFVVIALFVARADSLF